MDFEYRKGILERNGQLLEKLIESQIELIHGQNQTNRTLEEIKIAIKDIANLDDCVRKLENAVLKRHVNFLYHLPIFSF